MSDSNPYQDIKDKFIGLTTLLVEDNPTNRVVAKALLARMGMEVFEATNGIEGVSAAMERGYDIILMDCVMPEMDGYTATTQIRSDESNPNHATPIIALTANAFDEDKEHCRNVGMNDFIEKPMRPPEILPIIEKWVKSK